MRWLDLPDPFSPSPTPRHLRLRTRCFYCNWIPLGFPVLFFPLHPCPGFSLYPFALLALSSLFSFFSSFLHSSFSLSHFPSVFFPRVALNLSSLSSFIGFLYIRFFSSFYHIYLSLFLCPSVSSSSFSSCHEVLHLFGALYLFLLNFSFLSPSIFYSVHVLLSSLFCVVLCLFFSPLGFVSLCLGVWNTLLEHTFLLLRPRLAVCFYITSLALARSAHCAARTDEPSLRLIKARCLLDPLITRWRARLHGVRRTYAR